MCYQIDIKCPNNFASSAQHARFCCGKWKAEFSFDDDDDVANFGNLSTIGGGLGPGI